MIKANEALEKTKRFWETASEKFMEELSKSIDAAASNGQYSVILHFQQDDAEYMKDYVVERCRKMGYQAHHSTAGRDGEKRYYIAVRWG